MTHHSPLDVVIIETPNLGDRSYVVGHAGSRRGRRPAARHRPGRAGARRARLERLARARDALPQRLRLRRARARATHRRGVRRAHRHGHLVQRAGRRRQGRARRRNRHRCASCHTPGHTPNHLSYAVNVGGTDHALFTGGSMLFGSVGRPDLLGPTMTEPLAHAQWHSMRRLRDEVTHTAALYPTHGFGSFCSRHRHGRHRVDPRRPAAGQPSLQRRRGDLRRRPDRRTGRVPALLRPHGPGQPGRRRSDRPLAPPGRDGRRHRGRDRRAASGSSTYAVGASSPPSTCTARSPSRRARQRRDLPGLAHRLGHADHAPRRVGRGGRRSCSASSSASASTDPRPTPSARRPMEHAGDRPLVDYPRVQHAELSAAPRRRRRAADARPAPQQRVGRRPRRGRQARTAARAARADRRGRRRGPRSVGRPVWVYCGSGFRASIGCSILEAHGLAVVHVDDDFANAAPAGLPVTEPVVHETLGEAYAD